MANLTSLKITTPKGIFFEGDVEIVTVKTTEGGYIGLQYGRSPFVASLDISIMTIGRTISEKFREAAIAGGLVIADKKSVEIITDDIVYKEDIDLSFFENKKNTIEKELDSKLERAKAFKLELELKNAINKINVKKGA